MFSHLETNGHELVQFVRDPGTGLRAIILLLIYRLVRKPAT